MATKKKAKKKAVVKPLKVSALSSLALSLRDDVLYVLNSVRQDVAIVRAEFVRIREDMLAMREAVERLDRSVAHIDPEAVRQRIEGIEVALDVKLPASMPLVDFKEPTAANLESSDAQPTDAEILS